jgi:PKD repeat protein
VDFGGSPLQINADSALLAANGLSYKLVVIAQGDTCPNDRYIPPACFPNPNLTDVGFYPPDTMLDCVQSGTFFDEVIQFKNFDTVPGAALNLPIFNLIIVSVQIDSVRNMPPGITYECNNPGCVFLGAETGCVRMSGYTNAAPGLYNFGFYATVVANISGTNVTIPADSQLLANAGLGYSLRVIDAGTQCPNTFVPGPLSVSASSPSVVCAGDSVTLAASINGGTAPYTFAWSPPSFLSNPALPNPVLAPTHPGTYTVTVTDNSGATMSDAIIIQYADVPVVSISNDDTICPGSSVQISAAGGFDYYWTPATALNNPNIFNPTATPTASTTYTVHVSNANCISTDTVRVTLNASAPAANFSFIKNNFTVAFDNNTTNGTSYEWEFGDGETSTQQAPVHQYLQQQLFTVTLVATNACGLKDTFTATVDMSVGIAALAGEDILSVYPNPSNGIYQIKFNNPDAGQMDIEVVTLHGESVLTKNSAVKAETFPLDLSNQPKGIYFLKITQQNNSVIKKLVIQ